MHYNHTRNLNIGLKIIEEHLRDMIDKLNPNSSHSEFILYSIVDDVKPEVKHGILARINLMLDEIKQMKEDFALESENKSQRKSIISHINEIWILLEELMPKRMKQYGDMSVSDEKLIRNPISNLIAYTDDILSSITTSVSR